MRTFPALSPAWESSGWVLSLSQLLTIARTEARDFGVIVHSRLPSCDQTGSNPSAFLNGSSAEQFISMLRLPFPGTLELVSISQPVRTLRPLNASITSAGGGGPVSLLTLPFPGTLELVSISQPVRTLRPLNASITSAGAAGLLASWTNSNGGSAFIFSLQMNAYAAGGVSFVSLTKVCGEPDLVVAKHCPFSRTLLLSHATLVPTSRLRLVLASLATKECALFVMRCLKELQPSAGPGKMATDESFAAESSSWKSFMDLVPWNLNGLTAGNGNGAGVGLLERSAKTSTKPFSFARKSPHGPTCPREWDFSGRSSTPFKKNTSWT